MAIGSTRASANERGRNVTVDRAFELLLLFNDERPVITAAEAAAELGTTRSTTYRYLDSLRSYGFLADDPDRRGFRLGPTILELARIARRGVGLAEVALPRMRTLAEELRLTALMTQRYGDRVITSEREEPVTTWFRISCERDQVLPLNAAASTKVLLAFEPDETVDELLDGIKLERFTENTVTSVKTLRRQLETIREQGYAVSHGELMEGDVCVSAPVYAPDGGICAGISAVGMEFKVTDEVLPSVIERVRATADEVTAAYRTLLG